MPGKSQLTPELIERIAQHVQTGLRVDQSCRLAGVAGRNGYYWLQRATEDLAAGRDDTIYCQFADAIADAEARMEGVALERVREAAASGPKGWTAAAWLLERRFPERWSLRNRVELSGADGEPVQVVVTFAGKAKDAHGDVEAADAA